MERLIKVRLLADLTKYHSALQAGVEGYTNGQSGTLSRANDNYINVRFPNIEDFDILWKSLEIIDESYLDERIKREQKLQNDLRTARNVVLERNQNGEFKGLHYQYNDGPTSITNTAYPPESDKLITLFQEYGIKIKEATVIEKKTIELILPVDTINRMKALAKKKKISLALYIERSLEKSIEQQ